LLPATDDKDNVPFFLATTGLPQLSTSHIDYLLFTKSSLGSAVDAAVIEGEGKQVGEKARGTKGRRSKE